MIDHIEQHLAEELSLEALTGIAHYSPFHFHRLFSALMGETPSRFITRLRLERAASQLLEHPSRSVTRIATECGFTSQSAFARAFREGFSMTATQCRRRGYPSVADESGAPRTRPDDDSISVPSLTTRVETLPAIEVAYVRHVGPYAAKGDVFDGLFSELREWADSRGLLDPESTWLTVIHDSPQITEEDRLRVSAALAVSDAVSGSGRVGRMTLEGGRYAVARGHLGVDEYAAAWRDLMGRWLPGSGYESGDRHPFELYPPHREAPVGKTAVELCLPVSGPLRR